MAVSLRNSLYLFLIFIVVLITQAIGQPTFNNKFCDVGKNYTINRLLSILPSNIYTDDSGFYNSTYGQNSDKVYAMGLCRGDVKPEACLSWLNYSTNSITKNCPNQKEAIEWYDECMVRYSNRSIFGVMESNPRYSWRSFKNMSSNVDGFKQVLMTLLADLKNKAAAGDSLRKFATGNETAPNFQTIYAHVQCTPDLSLTQCTGCLDLAIGDVPQWFDGNVAGRVMSPSCYLRYEPYLFYEPTSSSAVTPPPPTPSPSTNTLTTQGAGKKINISRPMVIVVVPTVVCGVLIIFICAYLRLRKAKRNVGSKSKLLFDPKKE